MRGVLCVFLLLCLSCGYDHSPPDDREGASDGGDGSVVPSCTGCNAFVADSCGSSGQCACGGGPACGSGQQCVNGACRCTAQSCANGCCSNVQCVSGTDRFACGSGGAACTQCVGLRQCVSGSCR